jgi:uncharacterized protein (DUF924 family)
MLRRALDDLEQPDESRIAQGGLGRHEKVVTAAFASGDDRSFGKELQKVFVLPFAHSQLLGRESTKAEPGYLATGGCQG